MYLVSCITEYLWILWNALCVLFHIRANLDLNIHLFAQCIWPQLVQTLQLPTKRKGLPLPSRPKKDTESDKYPAKYCNFKKAQVQAHRKGVKKARTLFTKYMPAGCVDILKENGSQEKPYPYKKPEGCTVVNKGPPKEYSHLGKSFAIINQDIESQCNEYKKEGDINITSEECLYDNEVTADKLNIEVDCSGGRKWKISKCEDGNLTYIHIKQGLKAPLASRIYISLCQKRHWASQ